MSERQERFGQRRDRFAASEDSVGVLKRLAMIYHLRSVSRAYYDEIREILDKYHLSVGDIKFYLNKLDRDFDLFDGAYKTMIAKDEGDMVSTDFRKLQILCDIFMSAAEEGRLVHLERSEGRIVPEESDTSELCLVIGPDKEELPL